MSSPRLLSNRYEIGDTLGYGGMSEVHRGRDVRLGRDVAVKVLRADLARDPTFQLRFRREAQNAAALNHPAIVAVYDTGETESENGPLPYIVMEYVDGRTLRDIVKTEGPLAPRRAMEVMADASAALDFSHRHGIVHRDVKPANIMITDSGAVKVMDFGIARAVADGQAAVTQTAAVIGTAQYLSPEQARGETVDARSDVYAAGCVLFELLCGEPPFTGDSPVAVAYQHVREDPNKPSDLNEQVPAALDAVILKALSKNPANRYQSAAEMRSDLVRVLSGQRPKAPLVMSEDERTEMLAESEETELTATRRQQPAAAVPDDADDDFDRRRRRRWTIGFVTAACVAVFALVSWLAVLLFDGGAADEGPKKFRIVDVTGERVQVARGRLSEAGFENIVVRGVASPAGKEGLVVRQAPTNGMYPKSQQIKLFKGTGPQSVQVPDLSGMTMQEARKALQDRGLELNLDAQQTEVDDPNLVGKIVDQSEKGTVEAGTVISVTVGKAVQKQQVPNVTGLSLSGAKQTLKSSGFAVETNRVDSPKPADQVIKQSPSGGSQAKPNSTVTLTVSNGNQIRMPDLRGLTESQAEQELEDAGWNGNLSTEKKATSDNSLDDKVVSSQPTSGSKIAKEQDVTLYIGEYEASGTSTPGGGDFIPPFN